MALSDAVAQRPVKGPPCTVCSALETLPASEAAALQLMLTDPEYRYSQISDELAKPDVGIDIAPYTIGNHVRGRCKARVRLR